MHGARHSREHILRNVESGRVLEASIATAIFLYGDGPVGPHAPIR